MTKIVGDVASIAGRIAADANTMYFGRFNAGVDAWQLVRIVNGTFTQIGSNAPAAYVQSDHTVRLSMQGSTIKLIVDGVHD